ncbi:hypothetical protein GCM10009722_27480 [Williamsia deligens]
MTFDNLLAVQKERAIEPFHAPRVQRSVEGHRIPVADVTRKLQERSENATGRPHRRRLIDGEQGPADCCLWMSTHVLVQLGDALCVDQGLVSGHEKIPVMSGVFEVIDSAVHGRRVPKIGGQDNIYFGTH